MFSDRLELAERYARLLATDGVVRGLIGPREVPRLWERHLLNCAVLAEGLPENGDVCDIGSGAGLPGMVLAIVRPGLAVTLVEPLLRRTTFLAETVAALGLDNVEVVRARAEELHGTRVFTVVTSRAVAPLDRLLGWSMPLVRPGGALVAMKGASAQTEIESAAAALRRHRAGQVTVVRYGEDLLDPPTTAVRVESPAGPRLGWGTPGAAKAGPASRRKPKSRGKGR